MDNSSIFTNLADASNSVKNKRNDPCEDGHLKDILSTDQKIICSFMKDYMKNPDLVYKSKFDGSTVFD